eukprot:jgi/Galph1/1227/GphlegSOOS_G5952.1
MFRRSKSSDASSMKSGKNGSQEKRPALLEIGNILTSRFYDTFFVKKPRSSICMNTNSCAEDQEKDGGNMEDNSARTAEGNPNPSVREDIEKDHEKLYCFSPFLASGELEEKQQVISRNFCIRSVGVEQNVACNLEGGEYQEDILQVLFECEKRYFPPDSYFHNINSVQKEISPDMRAILIDWLVEVADEYKLTTETLHLACNYIDRVLSRWSVPKRNLQLLGIVCLFIASKYEEMYPPHLDEFVYITDNTYSKEEVLSMETFVMNILDFSFTVATSHQFVTLFESIVKYDNVEKYIAYFLCDLTLVDFSVAKYLPSVVATAAICLARQSCKQIVWDGNMERATKKQWEDVLPCLLAMRKVWESCPHSKLQAVKTKYSTTKYYSAASNVAPQEKVIR